MPDEQEIEFRTFEELAIGDTASLSHTVTRRDIDLCATVTLTGASLDGPLASRNAIDEAAAKEKGIVSQVAGRADILSVPDLESGNMLAEQLTFMAGAEAAGSVLGASVPIILTSRADSTGTRLASCALGALAARARATA